MNRKCDVCSKNYSADERNIKRGWGLCCSKSCAAKKRETSKPDYCSARVEYNNLRRANWNEERKGNYNDVHIFSDDAFIY
jgi:hypothetical protein